MVEFFGKTNKKKKRIEKRNATKFNLKLREKNQIKYIKH